MKAILTLDNLASGLVTTIWTPVFVAIFIAIIAYAFGPVTRLRSTKQHTCRCGRSKRS